MNQHEKYLAEQGKFNSAEASGESGLIWFKFPGIADVRCVFTTAYFGNLSLDVAASEYELEQTRVRRQRLLELCGIARWAELKQVHGVDIFLPAIITPTTNASEEEADGQGTRESNVGLAIKTADCQPILLAHISGKYIAALHVGWRGNAQNFIQKSIEAFCQKYAVAPAEVVAVRGPSLGPSAAEFINFEAEWGPSFSPWFTPTTKTMNLWALTKHQLAEAGLLADNIYGIDLCTHMLGGYFFSHRLRHTGRQISMIWKEGD